MTCHQSKILKWLMLALVAGLPLSFPAKVAAGSPVPGPADTAERVFPGKGVVLEVRNNELAVVIRHDAITNYMSAMTMPFTVLAPAALAGLAPGDEVAFQLHVTASTSWIDQITQTGRRQPVPDKPPAEAPPVISPGRVLSSSACSGPFTNELGQPVGLDDFRGQVLAVTFFYTRCPLPNYCPRLSRNFQEAEQKLAALPNAPTNWHLISISFDPEFDTPQMLRVYGESYRYDPAHWSFLTGSPDKIAELAKSCGVEYVSDAGAINHNFRTIIIDATGHVRMIFPFTGNFSDAIVEQILQAAQATNPFVSRTRE